MWGQVSIGNPKRHCIRIIPTRVGTRRAYRLADYRRWDHPHACGDKLFLHPCSRYSAGSSPRVWGQVEYTGERHAGGGIIPTRVGTRTLSMLKALARTDHPHACGDKFHNLKFDGSFLGSSPRVWGQGHRTYLMKTASRIIPTRVGTSFCKSLPLKYGWDHPHACGDKLYSVLY